MNSLTTKLKLLKISTNSYSVFMVVSLNSRVRNSSLLVNHTQVTTSLPSVLRLSLKTTNGSSSLVLPSVTVWYLLTNNTPNMLTLLMKIT